MPKIEITMSDVDKAKLQAAADTYPLKLATWAKMHLLIAAARRRDTGGEA